MRKRISVLIIILIIIVFVLVCLSSAGLHLLGRHRTFSFDKMVKHPNIEQAPEDLEKGVTYTEVFAEKYLTSYLGFLKDEIRPDLRSSFILASKKGISAKLFLSTVAESCLYLYPSEDNQLVVDCTKYQVQMALLTGLDSVGSSLTLTVPREDVVNMYARNKPSFFELKPKQRGSFAKMAFQFQFPKVFSFSEDCLVTLVDVSFVLVDGQSHTIGTVNCDHVAVMTGNSDFSFAVDEASALGRRLAEEETIRLIHSSAFFKELLVYDKLKLFAEAIQNKISKMQKDHDFVYPFPVFKKEIADLRNRAAKLGLDCNYVDDLLRDVSVSSDDGYLFWYYGSRTEYMGQWILVNVLFFVAVLSLRVLKRYCAFHKWRWARIITGFVKYSILVTVNGYVLARKPEALHVRYMVLPGLSFLACVLLERV